MTDLRVYLMLEDLQPQFAAYFSSPMRARAYPPRRGQHSLIIEVAPALSIHEIADLALKAEKDLEPGILFTERQFGLLELHSDSLDRLKRAGEAILTGIGIKASDQKSPMIIYQNLIEDLSDQHAIIMNRTRDGALLVPGTSMLICEVEPALFACVAANEAEKVVTDLNIHDVQMMGATGRLCISGSSQEMKKIQKRINQVLKEVGS